jgi:hypothetical protein
MRVSAGEAADRLLDISAPLYERLVKNRGCGGRPAPWSRLGGEGGRPWDLVLVEPLSSSARA